MITLINQYKHYEGRHLIVLWVNLASKRKKKARHRFVLGFLWICWTHCSIVANNPVFITLLCLFPMSRVPRECPEQQQQLFPVSEAFQERKTQSVAADHVVA